MTRFLLWMLLFYFSWPLALIALILYPIIWLLLLPFRIFGFAVGAIFELLKSIITLPVKLLKRSKESR